VDFAAKRIQAGQDFFDFCRLISGCLVFTFRVRLKRLGFLAHVEQ
jgi:hypothetical protein